jgi:hypothetical protein
MDTLASRHAEAERLVAAGHRILERQRALIAAQKAEGEDTGRHTEQVLATLQCIQEVFDADLSRARQERQQALAELLFGAVMRQREARILAAARRDPALSLIA